MIEGWYVDGVPLGSMGTVIEDQSGWHDSPGMRGDDDVLAGQHGVRWRPKKFGPGVVPMLVGIHGATSDWSVPAAGSEQRALFERNLEDFLRRVVRADRLRLVERVHAQRSGSTPRRQALCQVSGEITPQMSGFTYGLVSFEFRVPGVFWSDVDPTSQLLPFSVSGPSTQEVEVFALAGQTGYCADSVITVSGPCTSVQVVDAETGKGWLWPSALSAGQSLVVDSGAFTAEVDGSDVLVPMVFDGPNLLEIGPAPSESRGPAVLVAAPGAGPGFSVSATTRRKWLTP